ncbi:MAG: hypothetical protein AAB434_03465 [Planctomycetota bacterium]
MFRLALGFALVVALVFGCSKQDGPKLPSSTAGPSAQAPAPAANPHVHPDGVPGQPVSAAQEDDCCPPEGVVAGPVTGNEAGHECRCSELKPGCKCGHCSGAIPVCHCKHEKKPGE